MFVDEAKLFLKAGDGGSGCLSFRREKYLPKGGPDGGDGGNGGDVILLCDDNFNDLREYKYQPHWNAKNGRPGEGRNKHGADGADIVLRVPAGTQVFNDGNLLIAELLENGERVTLLKGGRGGLGNNQFKNSVNQAPRKTTPGKPGEMGEFVFKLKTIADIGLVGFPNAGKSSLTNAFTNAKPQMAPYPFTTKSPSVGIIEYEDYARISMADIPGLIEGASENKGLGHRFLKHIERCKLLIFIIDMAGTDNRKPADDYSKLLIELENFDPVLLEKPRLVVANKIDVEGAAKNLTAFKRKHKVEIEKISCLTGEGLKNLKQRLREIVKPTIK
ncbi:MAG: GTPase ObgE [Opitutales bacterium]|nr:GTPase ObgE [Opitutales bacterium]